MSVFSLTFFYSVRQVLQVLRYLFPPTYSLHWEADWACAHFIFPGRGEGLSPLA